MNEVAIEEIKKCSGTQFDPELAQKFIDMQDKIKEAKEDPEKFYKQYSVLQKLIDKGITGGF